MAGGVVFDSVSKQFGETHAVRQLSLHVEEGEFVVLVGPSGCGKTTALRMVAGLDEPTSGEISIAGSVVNRVAPKDRDIAMVFQSYALYPHMSVYENMAFGLKQRKTPTAEIRRRVSEAAGLLGLDDFLDRQPRQLSGGQRQRVALGRAIVRHPKVFLMDEPLSNLDAQLRLRTRAEIAALHRRLDSTFVYVTHDQVEAMTMGTRIAVMRDGVLQQFDTPQLLYDQPANTFVATFMGSPAMNLVSGEIVPIGEGAALSNGAVCIPLPPQLVARAAGRTQITLGLRPEQFSRQPSGAAEPGCGAAIRGEVVLVEPVGSDVFVTVDCGRTSMTARMDSGLAITLGEHLSLEPRLEGAHVFDNAGVRLA